MKTLRVKIYAISLMILMALIAGCSTMGVYKTTYTNGWYVVEVPYNIDKFYSAAVRSITSGQTYGNDGSNYNLRVNKKTSDNAILEASNDNVQGDVLVIELVKVSDTITKIAVKYGKNGNSVRSSAEVGIIIQGIN